YTYTQVILVGYNTTTTYYNTTFISKLDSNGNFVFAKALEPIPAGENSGQGIAVDADQNIYTTGYFTGVTDFDPGAGTVHRSASGIDAFVAKLSPTGGYVYGNVFTGASGDEQGLAITVDGGGSPFITG